MTACCQGPPNWKRWEKKRGPKSFGVLFDCVCVKREREDLGTWSSFSFPLFIFRFEISDLFFFREILAWSKARALFVSFLDLIHPSFIRGPLGCLFFFCRAQKQWVQRVKMRVCACAFALSYYIQQCERVWGSLPALRPLSIFFFFFKLRNDRDGKKHGHGRKEIPFVYIWSLSLSHL